MLERHELVKKKLVKAQSIEEIADALKETGETVQEMLPISTKLIYKSWSFCI